MATRKTTTKKAEASLTADSPQEKGQAEPAEQIYATGGITESCANCGQPATMRETTRAAVRDVFCSACGARAYGDQPWKLERIDAG